MLPGFELCHREGRLEGFAGCGRGQASGGLLFDAGFCSLDTSEAKLPCSSVLKNLLLLHYFAGEDVKARESSAEQLSRRNLWAGEGIAALAEQLEEKLPGQLQGKTAFAPQRGAFQFCALSLWRDCSWMGEQLVQQLEARDSSSQALGEGTRQHLLCLYASK